MRMGFPPLNRCGAKNLFPVTAWRLQQDACLGGEEQKTDPAERQKNPSSIETQLPRLPEERLPRPASFFNPASSPSSPSAEHQSIDQSLLSAYIPYIRTSTDVHVDIYMRSSGHHLICTISSYREQGRGDSSLRSRSYSSQLYCSGCFMYRMRKASASLPPPSLNHAQCNHASIVMRFPLHKTQW